MSRSSNANEMRFKKDDRVVWFRRDDPTDFERGTVTYIEGEFVYALFDNKSHTQFCYERNYEFESVWDSPLWKALR